MTTVFLDTETLGLHRSAPIWEFAAVRIADDGTEADREHFQILHNPNLCGIHWPSTLPEEFFEDYVDRYDPSTALEPGEASRRIAAIVDGKTTIAGSNPAFDMERITDLLDDHGITPGWHYHPLDVPTMAIGYLTAWRGITPPRPWKSDELSNLAGIDPACYRRHTAMGDVEWSLALYSEITDGEIW